MPYGSQSSELETKLAEAKNYFPNGQQSFPWWFNGSGFYNEKWTRQGTNSGTPHGTAVVDKNRGPFELSYETVETGPTVGRRVRDEKTGKYYWKRMPLTVMRLVKRRGTTRIVSNLTPNALSYSRVDNKYSGLDSRLNSIYKPDDRYRREYTGPFIGPFYPLGSSGPLIDLAQFASDSPSNYVMSEIDSISDIALAKLLSRVKNQDVNAAQVIAERRQTSRTIGDALSRLAKVGLQMKRGNFSGAAGTLFPTSKKQLSNDWLAFQYGWKPLLSDIEGAVAYLQSQTFDYMDVEASEKRELKQTLYDGGPSFARTKVTSTATVTVKYMARYKLVFQPSIAASRLGLTNPAALAWELIPFSFIADWALPIGQWLNNMDATLGLEFVSAHRTVFITEDISADRTFGGVDGDGYTWDTLSTGFKSKKVYCQRTIKTGSLGSFPLPRFRNPFSGTHIANAIALLQQLKKR